MLKCTDDLGRMLVQLFLVQLSAENSNTYTALLLPIFRICANWKGAEWLIVGEIRIW